MEIGHILLNGFDEGFWEFLEVWKGESEEDRNWVGLCKWNNNEYVFKYSKLPKWTVWWEKHISDTLHFFIPSIPHFAKVAFVSPLHLVCTDDGNPIPSIADMSIDPKWRKVDVLCYEKIEGKNWGTEIESNTSISLALSGIYQTLAAIHCAQVTVGWAHLDLHTKNIILRKNSISGPTINLYSFGNPLAIPLVDGTKIF
jgi:hypothetical protein